MGALEFRRLWKGLGVQGLGVEGCDFAGSRVQGCRLWAVFQSNWRNQCSLCKLLRHTSLGLGFGV